MRYLLVHLAAGMKRRIRQKFQDWKVFTHKAQFAQRLARLELQLMLGAQNVESRQRIVKETVLHNQSLVGFMKLAQAFFGWRLSSLEMALSEQRRNEASMRRSLSASVVALRDSTRAALREEQLALYQGLAHGQELVAALDRLKSVAAGVEKVGKGMGRGLAGFELGSAQGVNA